jgi:hypothetical protein
MFQWDEPIPASDVPCNPAVAIPASNSLFAAYDDRAHALRAQDVSRACLRGIDPPGLPTWPPPHVMDYPKSNRMIDSDVGNSDVTAARAFAERALETSGLVQPSTIHFGTDASGGLRLTSVPNTTDPMLEAKLAAGRTLAWRDPTRAPQGVDWFEAGMRTDAAGPPRGTPMRAEASGAAVTARSTPPLIVQPSTAAATKPLAATKPSAATRKLRAHAGNLGTAVPGLLYDLVHIRDIQAGTDSRYSGVEFVFGRGGRGLYVAIVIAIAAVIASSARCLSN